MTEPRGNTAKRRQEEEALRDSEERFRNVLEVSRDLIYKLNLQTRTYDYVSPSSLRLVGFAPQEIVAMGLEGVIERFHPDDREGFRTHASRLPDDAAEGREAPTIEYRWQCRDGEYRWLSDNRAFVLDEGGRALALVGTVRDITERKRAEEELRESEARYKALFSGAPEGMLVADLQTKQFRHANPAMCRMFGYTEEEFLRIGVADIHPKESLSYVLAEFEAQARGEKLLSADLPCQRKDGSLFYANVNTTMVVLDGRRCNVGFFTNATERKKAEEALRESEERFRTLASSAPIGIMLVDSEKGMVYCNKRFLSIFGLPWEKVRGFGWVMSLHPDEREAFLDERSKAMAEGREFIREFRLVTPQGETRWLSVHTTPLLSQEGASNTRVGTIEDISERKQAEEALRESDEQLRNVLEVSRDLIYKLNLQTHTYDYVSPSSLRLVGFAPQEIVAMGLEGVIERFHPDDRERFRTDPSRLPDDTVEGREAPTVEYRWQCRDGEYRWLSDNRAFVLDEAGRALALVGTVRDITEKMAAETALRESEERFRLAINATKDGLWEWDIQTNEEFFSPRWCEIIGYSFDDPALPHTYTSWASRIHPDDYDRVISAMNNHLQKGTRYDVDYRHRHKSGEYRWQNSKGQAVLDESGKPIKMVGCISDITERKRAEEALRESEQRFRNVLDVSRDFIYKLDLRTGTYDYASPYVLELTGFTPEEVVAMGLGGVSERVHPEDGKRLTEKMKDLTKDWGEGHRNALSVYRFRRKDGEYRWFSDNSVFIRYSNEQPATLVGAVRDITAEKQAEEEMANRLKMESGIAQASTLLAGPEDADAGLDLALRILGEAFGADRAHIFLFRDDDTRMDNTSEWCAPGVEPRIDDLQDLDCAVIPWWMGKLAQNELIIMTNTSAAPPEAAPEKKSWKALNIHSLLAVPLLSDGKLIGYVRFANMESASNEREEDIRLLRLASESITSFIERQRAGEDKRKAYESIVMLLATGAEARDPYTEDHLPRMRGFAEAMAAELGLPPGEIREIGLCSLLHDLGKMRVPDSILIKPGPLSQAEWKIMKQHSAWGEELLSTHPWLETARQIARWHHENWDGGGYPDGLRGEEIPLCAAIVAVADGFDAMISDRPYKKAWPPRQAIVEIRAQKGRQYSPDAVEAFNRALRKGRIGRITSGDSARLSEMSEAA